MPDNSITDEFSEKSSKRKIILQFFPKFMTEVSSIMAKICKIIFWVENDPFRTFPKIHPFWSCYSSLIAISLFPFRKENKKPFYICQIFHLSLDSPDPHPPPRPSFLRCKAILWSSHRASPPSFQIWGHKSQIWGHLSWMRRSRWDAPAALSFAPKPWGVK